MEKFLSKQPVRTLKTKPVKNQPNNAFPKEFFKFLSWQKSYQLEQIDLDSQHKELFEIALRFYQCIKKPDCHKAVWRVFTEFLTQTKTHFEFEEQLMEEHCYPYYQLHRMVHKDMIFQTSILEQKIIKWEYQPKINDMKILHQWLIQHILSDDKKLTDFLVQSTSKPISFHSL